MLRDGSSDDEELDDSGRDMSVGLTAMADDAYGMRPRHFGQRHQKPLVPPACVGGMTLVCAGVVCAVLSVVVLGLVVSRAMGGPHVSAADQAVRAAWTPFAAALAHIANNSARACRDGLYAHVCGRWNRTADGASTFADAADGVSAQLLLLAGTDQWPLVSTWFDGCMDGAARMAHGTDALHALLGHIAGVHGGDSWARALAALHEAGIDAIFSVGVDVDDAAPLVSPQLLYIDEPQPLLPLVIWTGNDSVAVDYRTQFVGAMRALVGNDTTALAAAVDSGQIAPALSTPAALRTRVRRNLVPAAQLPGTFAWPVYWAARGMAPAEVAVASPTYLATVGAMLGDQNDWKSLRAYLTVYTMATLSAALPTPSPDARDCLASTLDALGDLLSHLWVTAYFDANTTRPAVEAMVDGVLAAVARRIAAAQWMDEATRAAAAAKLASLHVMIGFPDQWDASLPPTTMFSGDHLADVVAQRTAQTAANLAELGRPASRAQWLMLASDVNAYYNPTTNSIVIPAGIVRAAFYAPTAPAALNWGALGVVIGHEVTHAFDDEGRMYDATGARRNWWSAASAAAFEQRATCIRTLYDGRPGSSGGAVDGQLTLGENIADMGGLAVAHDAYRAALHTLYPTHAGRRAYEHNVRHVFGTDHDELFYAAYARMWCADVPPLQAYARLLTDPHAPPRWRVDMPASQSADYAAAYGCAAPARDACTVW